MTSKPPIVIVEKPEIERLIKIAIREHELRVAIFSGITGLLLLAGTWHAILIAANR